MVVVLPPSCVPSLEYSDVLWPFRPDWRESVRMIRSFRTDVTRSTSGREQRRGLRNENRRSIQMMNYFTSVDGNIELNRLLTLNQFGRWLVPNWTEYVRLTAPVSGSGIVSLDEEPDWFDESDTVVLSSGTRVETAVLTKDSNSTIVTIETNSSWPVGTKVMPALRCFMEDSVASGLVTDRVRTFDLEFEEDPGSSQVESLGTPEIVFNDREVFPFEHNWGDPIELVDEWPVERIDHGYGPIFRSVYVDHREQIRRLQVMLAPRSEGKRFQQFFMRQLGQLGEFYLDTNQEDIILAQPPTQVLGGDILIESTIEFSEAFDNEPTRRAVVLVRNDGVRVHRKITAVFQDSNSGPTAVLVFETQTVEEQQEVLDAINDLKRISWLHACRFATDEITVEWRTDEVAVCQTSVRVLEDLNPDTGGDDSNSNSATG